MTDEERMDFAEKSDAEWRAERDAEREARRVTLLRDRFAGQALIGYSANFVMNNFTYGQVADFCYRMADAMLCRRAQ